MNICLRGVALLGCLLVSACGSKTQSPAAPSAPSPTAPAGVTLQSVRLGPTGGLPRWWAPGATNQTIATGTFSDGTTQNITTSCTDWQSDNAFVLTINNAGLMTAHNSGSATITTTCQGVFARGLVPLNVMPATPWTRSGRGGTFLIVEVPLYVSRLRITARSDGRDAAAFVVNVEGQPAVQQRPLPRNVPYDATHPVVFRGVCSTNFICVEIYDSGNTTAWTLTEVR